MIALLFIGIVSLGIAQPLQSPYPWSLSPLSTLDSFSLPIPPLRTTVQKGRISIREGKLVYPDGSRARLYGVTIAGPAVFPDSAQAVAVARRLHSLGINLVRLTLFDYTNYNDASILIRSNTTSRGFDSSMLRRFDWFIAQLRQHGIYVSLVLRSTRLARREDGIIGWDSIRYAGRLYSYFLPSYQLVVRDYIRDLLTRRNQFTGVPYRDDPTIAILEIDQDNSLITQWISNTPFPISQGGQLSYLHSRILDSAFIRFVLNKYRTAQAAQQAWSFAPRSTANVITNSSFEDAFDNTWLLSVGGNALAISERDPLDKKDGSYSMRIRIAQPGTAPGNIRYRNITPQLQRYALYRIQLWAKTDVPSRLITIAIGNFSVRDTLRSQWREYTYTFRSNVEGAAEFRVEAGAANGDVWLDNVRVTAVPESGLVTGESFATYTVARSRYQQHTEHSLARWRDNLEFYQALTESWYNWIYRLVHDTLGCRALIAPGNQLSTLNEVYASRLLDLPSVGTGWDSPYRRVAGATSDSAWYILNDPQLGNRFGGIIFIPARIRITGKPLMVCSYSVPYPFASMAEMTMMVPAYLAYQDADVFVLTYYAYNRASLTTPWVRDRYGVNAAGTITHYEYAGNPAVISALPLSTHVFRQGIIAPARDTLFLRHTQEALSYPPYNQSGGFFLASGTDNRLPLFRRIEIDSFNAVLQSFQPHREVPALADQGNVNIAELLSDTGELLWNASDTVFIVRTSFYRAATGVIRGKIIDLSGRGTHTIERLDNGWIGTAEFLSLDRTLDSAEKVLMALHTRTSTTGAIWDGDSTTYRRWGDPPMQMEAMQIVVSIRHNTADSLLIIPLDTNGIPQASRAWIVTKSGGRFRFTIDQRLDRTVWYSLRFLRTAEPLAVKDNQLSSRRILLRSSLPDRLEAVIEGYIEGTPIHIAVYSLDGRRIVQRSLEAVRAPSEIRLIDLSFLGRGAYICTLTVGTQTIAEKVLVAP
ncbi:MAG: hypothetical protein NZ481_00835 [Candidatus Kapabacteria bacterium]|nr:hypothetical protein [Candidatus Kapabacteria bacterium]